MRIQSTVALSWLLQAVVAVILVQTLFFKFTGAEESIFIFTTLGAEPWGRIGSGLVELAASILLLMPRAAVHGAMLALGTMAGAIMSHLTVLGIDIQGDGGLLFTLALLVFTASGTIVIIRRAELPIVGTRFSRLGEVR